MAHLNTDRNSCGAYVFTYIHSTWAYIYIQYSRWGVDYTAPDSFKRSSIFDCIGLFSNVYDICKASLTTTNKTKRIKKCEKWRPQLVINSLHFNNGELEACSRSSKTDVKFFVVIFRCYYWINIVNSKNKSSTINNSLFVSFERSLHFFVFVFLWFFFYFSLLVILKKVIIIQKWKCF